MGEGEREVFFLTFFTKAAIIHFTSGHGPSPGGKTSAVELWFWDESVVAFGVTYENTKLSWKSNDAPKTTVPRPGLT